MRSNKSADSGRTHQETLFLFCLWDFESKSDPVFFLLLFFVYRYNLQLQTFIYIIIEGVTAKIAKQISVLFGLKQLHKGVIIG